MPTVSIRLLGGFSVRVGEREVQDSAWRLRKARSLVKLLALAPGHAVHREVLCEAFWPDRDALAARNNLHQAMHVARRALATAGGDGREALGLRGELVVLGPEASVCVDVERFEAVARTARATRDATARQQALELYGGELLPEDRYEPWAEGRRAELAELQLALLLELAELESEAGDVAGAVESLLRAVAAAPLHEPAHRALMRALADAGRRQEALARYERLRSALRETLGADPDPETRRLYRRLLTGSLADGGDPSAPVAPQRHNLRHEATSFVGRELELADINRRLAQTRLLTLTGAGGSGKSRLARELARRRAAGFEHGAWLVQLAPLSDPELVVSEAASALGLALPDRGSAQAALVEQLAGRQVLVLLDNCEHVIDVCAALASAIMGACPGVTLLATSREPLRVEGEVAWRVPPLALPDLERLPALPELLRLGSVRLFADRAADASPGFEVDARNARAVAELCHRLDGMPLAPSSGRHGSACWRRSRSSIACGSRSACWARVAAWGLRASARSSRRSRGAMTCSPPPSGCSSAGSPSSPAASASRPPSRCAAPRPSHPNACSTSSAAWSTSRSSPSSARAGPVATGCSRPCASTRASG